MAFVVLHNMLMTHQGGADRAPISAEDITALQNEQVVYVLDDNYRNPLREMNHQRDTERLLQSSWCIGLVGQNLRCAKQLPWGQKKLASINPFQDYPIIPRTFI